MSRDIADTTMKGCAHGSRFIRHQGRAGPYRSVPSCVATWISTGLAGRAPARGLSGREHREVEAEFPGGAAHCLGSAVGIAEAYGPFVLDAGGERLCLQE